MRQWGIINDRIVDYGEVPYLGVHYDRISNGEIEVLPNNYQGWFPFLRFCYSLGDLGIVSGVFEALKHKYPNIKIAWPSKDYIKSLLGEAMLSKWAYNGITSWESNIDSVMSNNPYLDLEFNQGDFDRVFTDHDRAYTGLVEHGGIVSSCEEPLAEQILRRFGFTDQDITSIDSKPKLYFSENEIEQGEAIIKKYFPDQEYGCLLFGSRIAQYNRRWESDKYLIAEAYRLRQSPCFYYSTFNIQNTEWRDTFTQLVSFSELKVPIRVQMYIKHRSKFNLGYQAGITDACSGGNTETITLCPYPTIRENCIRGVKYIFSDGSKKQF